jgi:translocation and assembly module TamB
MSEPRPTLRRRFLLAAAITAAVVGVLVAALGAAVMLRPIREAVLVRVMEAQLRGVDVRIEGLANPDLSVIEAARVSFGPAAQPDVVVERFRATFDPLTLLRSRLAFAELAAAVVAVDVTEPESSAPRRRPPYQTLGFVLRELAVERLAVERLEFRDAGALARTLAVTGSLTETGGRPVLNLSVRADGDERAELRTTVSDGVFRVETEAAIAGVALSGLVSVQSVDDRIAGRLAATLPAGLLDGAAARAGALRIDAEIGGTLAVPRATARATLDALDLDGRRLAPIEGTFELAAEGLAIEGLTFDGRGTVADLAAALPELAPLLDDAGEWTARGRLADLNTLRLDRISLAGRDLRAEGSTELRLDTGAFTGSVAVSATGAGRLAGEDDPGSRLSFTAATADSGVTMTLDAVAFDGFGAKFSGAGEVRLAPDRNDVAAARISGEAAAGDLPLKMSAALTGPWAAAQMTARAEIAGIDAAGLTFNQTTVDLTARRDAAGTAGEWQTATLLADAPMAARGTWRLTPDRRLDVLIAALSGRGLSGSGSAALELASSQLSGRVAAAVADLGAWTALAGVVGAGSAEAALDLSGAAHSPRLAAEVTAAVVELGPLAAQAGAFQGTLDLGGDGSPRLDARLALEVGDVAGQPFEFLTLTAQGPADRIGFAIDGAGGAGQSGLTVRGTVLARADATQWDVESLDVRIPAAAVRLRAPLTITTAGDRIDLPAAAFELNGGAMDLAFNRTASALLADIALRDVGARLFAEPDAAEFDSRIAATLVLRGAPSAADADLAAMVTGLGADSPTLRLTAAARDGALRFAGRLTDGATDTARLEATVPGRLDAQAMRLAVAEDAPVSASFSGRGDLARLARWLPLGDLDVAGTLSGAGSLAGTITTPQLSGSVAVSDGSFEVADLGLVLRRVEATATAAGPGAVDVVVAGTDAGKGTFSGIGRIEWAETIDSAAATLRVALADLRVLDRDTISSRVSGQLDYEGGIQAGRLSGTLTTDDTEVFLAGAADPEIPLLRAPARPADAIAAADIFMGATDLDIAIEARRPVQVSGQGIDSAWQGGAKVGGTLAAPAVTGTLTLQAGNAAFLGQSFDLTAGRIELTGASPVDPVLDITAERTREEVTAIVKVSGRASAPKLEISSSPPYPRDEILSRILFGKDMRRLGPLEAAQIAAASTNVMGEGPGLMRVLRRGLAVDYLGLGGRSGEAIEVRKDFGRRLSIGLEQEVSGQERLFTVEWRLTPRISLRSTSDGQTGGDIGLSWSRDY